MKLSSQFVILITLIFLAIFSGNFIISISNMKEYLELETRSHAQDTATSLGLSISPYSANPKDPIIETMMNAIFDRGYYQEIIYMDADEKVQLHLENREIFTSVPKWFKRLITMQGSSAKTRVSNGWNHGGTLIVRTNTGYAYYKLYEQAKSALFYAVVAFMIAMGVVLVFIKWLLQPLKSIEQLAVRIAKGKFETIKKLPWTTEIKNVALSMNFMSKKIEEVITKLNTHLNEINHKLKCDPLTGMEMKSSFITALKHAFMYKKEGFVVFARISDLSEFAKEHNGKEVEFLIKGFAALLEDMSQKKLLIKAYHFFGAEFALLVEGIEQKDLIKLFDALQVEAVKLGNNVNKKAVYHLGVSAFDTFSNLSTTLASADEALEQASVIGDNSYYFKERQTTARNMDAWRELVTSIITASKIDIEFVGSAIDFDQNKIFMKEVFTKVYDENNEAVPIGTFVSLAEKYEKIIELDQAVISKVIEHIKVTNIGYEVAVNLSMDTIASSKFRTWLYKTLNDASKVAPQLVFTLTAYAASKDSEALKSFIVFVHRLGAKVMIKRFESESMSLETVKSFELDYIRLARDYTQGVSRDTNKEAFVSAMKEIGALLHIKIFSESCDTEDKEHLKSLGLFGSVE